MITIFSMDYFRGADVIIMFNDKFVYVLYIECCDAFGYAIIPIIVFILTMQRPLVARPIFILLQKNVACKKYIKSRNVIRMLRVSSVEHRGFGAGALKQPLLFEAYKPYRLTVFLSNVGLQVLLSGTPVTVGTLY